MSKVHLYLLRIISSVIDSHRVKTHVTEPIRVVFEHINSTDVPTVLSSHHHMAGYISMLYNIFWSKIGKNIIFSKEFVLYILDAKQNIDSEFMFVGDLMNSVVIKEKTLEDMESDCKVKVVQDVEEGEISDSTSVEEISEEAFKIKQAPPPSPPPPPPRSSSEDGNQSKVVIDVEDDDADDDDMEEGERKIVDSIKNKLDMLNVVADAEKSFDRFCSNLENTADNLQKMALEGSFAEKDNLVQLLATAIQNLHSVFFSMTLRLKEQNRGVLSRLLAHVTSLKPPIFTSMQIKEMEAIISSMDSLSNDNDDKKKLKKREMESGFSGSFAQKERSFSFEHSKSGLVNSKHKGLSLPLLDLHKDHDADSLPSPTRELSAPLLFDKGLVKPEWPVPRRTLDRENYLMHPYETDAVKAVSSYQQKFNRSSIFMNDKLPSPTPSEEGDTGDGEMSGEVSSSIIHKLGSAVDVSTFWQPMDSSMNTSTLRQSLVPSTTSTGTIVDQRSSNPKIAGPLTVNINPVSKSSSARSRDPRLRLANQSISSMGIKESKSEPFGMIGSRKQKTVEELVLDGPALKRQRSEPTTGTGTGGWLEDRGTVGIQVTNGTICTTPNLTTHANEKFQIGGQSTALPVISQTITLPLISATSASLVTIPTTTAPVSGPFTLPSTSQSATMAVKDSNNASLQSLLRDIAVNPSIWMNILKMEHQKSSDFNKSISQTTNLNSTQGAVPSKNASLTNSSMLGQISAGTVQTPPQTISMEESGKVRMKPRDPRRALHNNAPEKGGADQPKVHASVSSAMTGNLDTLRHEDNLEKKSVSASTVKPPDITRQFTSTLKSIANIVSVSQASMSSPAVPQIPSPQTVPSHQSGMDTKASEEAKAGPSQPPNANAWSNVEHLFDGFDDQQKVAIQRERSRRLEEQKKMFAVRKLCLVLDLDHTLLNSAKFVEVDPLHDELLRKKEEQDREKPYRHLFRFPHMAMWTKLRPGIWNFLEKASKLFELHLYTMGNKYYATEMAKLLDPKGELFSGRVISRGDDGEPFDGDDRAPKTKDLEGVLGMESGVVIIDDSVRVWPHNKLNLIVVERYIYFPCSRRQFGLPGPSLLEIDHDERPEDGTLASCLAVIERIHQNFFAHKSLDEADARNILASEQRKILSGCRIVFSRVFPVGEANPHMHPLWQTAEQFGAVCTNQIDDQVTHVVANSLGTDKVNWALSSGKFVVHPGWVEASALLYRRANEHDFAIKQQ
ncbi:hypothetical protein BUALT_Bualt17G0010700 [Buddleja alternifolia]|uniref:protein-serine/threonine phosphatase n=1 Tax=Buddleja alternifolia TaxID=168488 RepID=A0AAV6W5X8_9LAMI|nr:hypothetical protein BUALT_Bualt17G0010700 [Buddleja alternifolia]